MNAAERARGVVAFSSGNHGQGVAKAAAMYGVSAKIIMPSDTPRIKIENVQAFGAEVILFNRATDNREEISEHERAKTDAILIPPFNDAYIIAGQGTVGLEIVAQLAALGKSPEHILTCCSGGGLMAGIALAAPNAKLYPVEPEGFDDYGRSLKNGVIMQNTLKTGSICDGLLSQQSGDLTFAINKTRAAYGLVMTDAQVKVAMRFAFNKLKLVLEPSGAIALAALLTGAFKEKGIIVATLSGGNVDAGLFTQILNEA
jgi:threonine dehydratase